MAKNTPLTSLKGKINLTEPGKEARLGNIANPKDNDDAVNKGFLESYMTTSLSKTDLGTLINSGEAEIGTVYKLSDPGTHEPLYYVFNESTYSTVVSQDRYSNEIITFTKVTNRYDGPALSSSDVDNVTYIKIGNNYYQRVFKELNPDMWGAKPDYNSQTNTVVTDSTTAFEACSAASKMFRGTIRISPSYYPYGYVIRRPFYIDNSITLYGVAPSSTLGSKIFAHDNFIGDGVILSDSWRANYETPANRVWFWNKIEGIFVNCRGKCNYGIGIYQANEDCMIERTVVNNAVEANYYAAGEHAPFTMLNVNGNSAKYLLQLGPHPTDGSVTASGGVINILGISGDSHTEDFIHVNGSHRGNIFGIKAEALALNSHKSIIHFAGTHTGGSQCVFTISGAANRASSADIVSTVIRVTSTNRPKINIVQFNAPNTNNWIIDGVLSTTVPTSVTPEKLANFVHGDIVKTHNTILYETAKMQVSSGGTLRDLLYVDTGLITYLRAARNNGLRLISNDGQEGVRVTDDNAGNAQIGFYGATAISKPTVSGATGGNVALQNLLTTLANLGLITNSTT